MSVDDIQVVLAMALYFIVVLSVGFFYLKKSNASSENYFLGGRGLGPWLTALSAEASDMSGWLLMGLPGIAYFTGASDAMWTAIGLAIGTYLNWRFVAKRLRKYSEIAGNAITLPDFFSNRFRDDKRILMSVAAIIILLFFCIYCNAFRPRLHHHDDSWSARSFRLHLRGRLSFGLYNGPYPGRYHDLRAGYRVRRQRGHGGRRGEYRRIPSGHSRILVGNPAGVSHS